jgi:hypothetical protein
VFTPTYEGNFQLLVKDPINQEDSSAKTDGVNSLQDLAMSPSGRRQVSPGGQGARGRCRRVGAGSLPAIVAPGRTGYIGG